MSLEQTCCVLLETSVGPNRLHLSANILSEPELKHRSRLNSPKVQRSMPPCRRIEVSLGLSVG